MATKPTGTTREFGITSSVEGLETGLIVNSLSFSKNTETAEARNKSGQVIDIASYSKKEDVSVNGLFVGAGIEPGTIVSIGDKDYLVTSSTKEENNTAFQTGTINCSRSDEAVLWPMSSFIDE